MPRYEHAIPLKIEATALFCSDEPTMTADEINQAIDRLSFGLASDVIDIGGEQMTAELIGPLAGMVWVYDKESGEYPGGYALPEACDPVTPDPVAAAAPDMLAALKAFADEFEQQLDFDEEMPGTDTVDAVCRLWPAIRAAIAKAEGKAMQAIAREALGRTADSGIADKIELAFRSGYACGMDHGSDEGHEDGCDGAWLDQQSVLLPKKAL